MLASPAVDAGDNLAPELPALAFLGHPRIENAKGLSSAVIDMGVYEYPGVPAPVPPPPDFALTVNPSSIAVQQGMSGIFTVTVTPTAANLGTVLLTCSGLPASTSCSFTSPALSIADTSPQSSTVTISSEKAQAGLSRTSSTSGLSIVFVGLFLFPSLLLCRRGSLKRRVPWGVMLRLGAIWVISSCAALSGCGPDRFSIVVPPETYQLAVQGAAVDSSSFAPGDCDSGRQSMRG